LESERYLVQADHVNSLSDVKLMKDRSTKATDKYLILEATANCLELADPERNLGWLEENASFLKILFKVEYHIYYNYYYLERGAGVNYRVRADYVNCLRIRYPRDSNCDNFDDQKTDLEVEVPVGTYCQ
jgi:hypothetical protein